MMRDSSSHTVTLWDWIERLLKVTGLLALFGYMSLRAHFSFLGISFVSTLPTEQYLMETYRFATYLVSILAPVAAILILILSILPTAFRARATEVLARRWFQRTAVLVIVVGLLAFALRMLQLLSQYGTDVAVGTLKYHNVDRGAGQIFCAVTLIGTAGTFLIVRHALQNSPKSANFRWAWTATAVLLLLVTLQIPILYGYYVHTTELPLVLATIGDDKQQSDTCGLLLFDTGADMLLWNTRNEKGLVQQVPKSRLRNLIILGQADLLSQIQLSLSQQKSDFPTCQP
jgi:hypothetical protein